MQMRHYVIQLGLNFKLGVRLRMAGARIRTHAARDKSSGPDLRQSPKPKSPKNQTQFHATKMQQTKSGLKCS
jgi:hypothetical protein